MVKKIIWLVILAAVLVYAVPKLLFSLSIWFSERDTRQEDFQEDTYLFPPVLDAVPHATNSARLAVSGFSQNAQKVEIIINGISKQTISSLGKDGNFTSEKLSLYEGENTITAVSYDASGKKSAPSSPAQVLYKQSEPKLVIDTPEDHASYKEKREIEIRGVTDPDSTVTINGRWIRVSADGSFTHEYRLGDGEQPIEIISRDSAGNTKSVTRTVSYSQE